mgnify:CR=1 FL=1
MKIAYRYFLVESGELLEKCRDRLNRVHTARVAASEFARQRGAAGYYDGFSGKIFALHPGAGDPPAGWKTDRKGRWVPSGGKRNKTVLAEINALPSIPQQHAWCVDKDPAEWIGFPFCDVGSDGVMHGVSLPMYIATAGGEHAAHAIAVPAEHHGLTFPVPSGCREVTEAQWKLICAQAEVDAEQRARDAA